MDSATTYTLRATNPYFLKLIFLSLSTSKSNIQLPYTYRLPDVVLYCNCKSLQSCPTLCDPRDGSPPGSPVPGILQARTLEWVAISFSNAWNWKVKVKLLSHVWLLAIPWTAAHQAPPSLGFTRQEHWSGARVQPRWIQEIRSGDGVGEVQETTA